MPDIKISDMTGAPSASVSDRYEIENTLTTFSVTGQQIKDMVNTKNVNSIAGPTTVVAADIGTVFNATASLTLTLSTVASLGVGFVFAVKNTSGGNITIAPDAADTIDGAASLTLLDQGSAIIVAVAANEWGSIAKADLPDSFTQGAVPFGGPTGLLIEDTANLRWDNTSKRFEVGPADAALAGQITAFENGSTLDSVVLGKFGAGSFDHPITKTYRARNTLASPAAVVNGDVLSEWSVWAYHGTGYGRASFLRWTASTPVGTSVPSSIELSHGLDDGSPSAVFNSSSSGDTRLVANAPTASNSILRLQAFSGASNFGNINIQSQGDNSFWTNVTSSASNTTLSLSSNNSGSGAGNLNLTAGDEIDLTSGTLDINATGAMSVDSGDYSAIHANYTLSTASAIPSWTNTFSSAGLVNWSFNNVNSNAAGIGSQMVFQTEFTCIEVNIGNTASASTRFFIHTNAGAGAANMSFFVDDQITFTSVGFSVQSRQTWKRRSTAVSTNSGNEVFIAVTNTASPRTVTLLNADRVAGRVIIIKDESGGAGTNAITIDPEGGTLIDGVATLTIAVNYGAMRVYSNGTAWFTF